MTHRVIIARKARWDIEEAHSFLSKVSEKTATKFVDALDEVLQRIGEFPELHAVVDGPIRMTRLRRFPYVVGFVFENNEVVVLGLLHGHQDPKEWTDRRL